MSWQTYVDSNLLGSGKLSAAAIYGLDKTQWATSPSFALAPAEIDAISKGFKDAAPLQASGIKVNGVKYITIKTDDRSIYGKQGGSGVCCVKTKQAVLVGLYAEGMQPGAAAKVVEGLADYLIGVNY